MEKIYEAPEAIVVEFVESDLLKLSPGVNGNPEEIGW